MIDPDTIHGQLDFNMCWRYYHRRAVLNSFPNPRRSSDDEKPFLCLYAVTDTINIRSLVDDRRLRLGVGSTIQLRSLQAAPLAQHRSISRRTHAGRGRRAGTAERVLYRPSERRGFADGRLWTHLDAHLRRTADRLNRM